MASGGYPGSYQKGQPISGTENNPGLIFHAGTTKKDNELRTSGGRVLAVVGLADNLHNAREQAYHATKQITWPEHYYRKDIGQDLLNR